MERKPSEEPLSREMLEATRKAWIERDNEPPKPFVIEVHPCHIDKFRALFGQNARYVDMTDPDNIIVHTDSEEESKDEEQ